MPLSFLRVDKELITRKLITRSYFSRSGRSGICLFPPTSSDPHARGSPVSEGGLCLLRRQLGDVEL